MTRAVGSAVVDKKKDKKKAREHALLLELQRDHGYAFQELPENQRLGMSFSMSGKNPKLIAIRFVKLSVPTSSLLSEALTAWTSGSPGPARRDKTRVRAARSGSVTGRPR